MPFVSPFIASLLLLGGGQPPVAPVPLPSQPPAITAPDDQPDYPDALLAPASPKNFKPANRPVDGPITMVVIHDIEGTAISTVHWFQNPVAQVTSHYIIASDGTIYQSVKEHNIAWHAGNRNVNGAAIGIEHEGYAYRPGYYATAEYEASARLVRSITTRYNIPRDRTHIIGHFEVPSLTHPGQFGGSSGHTDPGPWWDWDSYMTMVRSDARVGSASLPTVLHPGEQATVTVTLTNAGDDLWPAPAVSHGADKASEAADAIARRAQGLVYLGMWSDATAPLPTTSAFFGTGWVSPRYAAPASGDTAPNTDGMFALTLNGPRTLGPMTEQFRLFQVPIAPRLPVGFGPKITANVVVQPWEIIVGTDAPMVPPSPSPSPSLGASPAPAPSAVKPIPLPANATAISATRSFNATGWNVQVGAFGSAPTVSTDGKAGPSGAPSPAVWQVTLPISGDYDVYVNWSPAKNATKAAQCSVNAPAFLKPTGVHTAPGSGGVMTDSRPINVPVTVDQRKGGGEWHLLGRYYFNGKPQAIVTLSPQAADGGIVAAGQIRLVGPMSGSNDAPAPLLNGAGPRP